MTGFLITLTNGGMVLLGGALLTLLGFGHDYYTADDHGAFVPYHQPYHHWQSRHRRVLRLAGPLVMMAGLGLLLAGLWQLA